MGQVRPWQLLMFQKGLKKNLRLKALKRYLGSLGDGERCLLLTCGDNNGAMNYFLRELGGSWTWADLEAQCIPEMSELLGETVHYVPDGILPFDDGTFDYVVTIDVHEHVERPKGITEELRRVTKAGGRIMVTVPNGDETRLAVRIKHALNMTKETYGHKRVGFTPAELNDLMTDCRIQPHETYTFSRFFTEMLELSINWAYVKILARRAGTAVDEGEIAPATKEKLESVGKSYRIYSLIFPVYWLLSQLDRLLFWQEGYCVLVTASKDTP